MNQENKVTDACMGLGNALQFSQACGNDLVTTLQQVSSPGR